MAGLFFDPNSVRGALSDQFRGLLGGPGSQAIDAMIQGASSASAGRTSAALGVVLLLAAALGVVVQLKDALNTIWEVEDPPTTSAWWYLRTYLISSAGILALGLLLAISLVVSTALTALGGWYGLSASESVFWQVLTTLFSISVLTLLFALLFKFFPDTYVPWHSVWGGAIATAVLFEAGKLAISTYVGLQAFKSTYGAATSFVVLLIWVYYSAQIVLFGAELTHATMKREGTLSLEPQT